MTHICVGNLTIIGSDNGLSPGRRQAITWTNVGILLIGPLGTNYSEMLIEIRTFSFKKIHFKMSSGKWRPFCLGLNVLKDILHHRSMTPKYLMPTAIEYMIDHGNMTPKSVMPTVVLGNFTDITVELQLKEYRFESVVKTYLFLQ